MYQRPNLLSSCSFSFSVMSMFISHDLLFLGTRWFLARDVFVRTNRRAIIAMVCVRLSVYLWRACIVIIRCTYSADLSTWLDSPMSWAPWHQSMFTYSQPSFSSSTWKRGGVQMCKLGVISQERLKIELKLLLNANRKLYMPRPLAQQRMTLSDVE